MGKYNFTVPCTYVHILTYSPHVRTVSSAKHLNVAVPVLCLSCVSVSCSCWQNGHVVRMHRKLVKVPHLKNRRKMEDQNWCLVREEGDKIMTCSNLRSIHSMKSGNVCTHPLVRVLSSGGAGGKLPPQTPQLLPQTFKLRPLLL